MSRNNEKLNDAFGEVDSRFITATQTPPIGKKRMRIRLIAAAICLFVLFASVFAALLLQRPPHSDTESSADESTDSTEYSALGWELVSFEKGTLNKKKIGNQNALYTLAVKCNKSADASEPDPAEDVCSEIFGQWLFSYCTFDYSLQFSLFPEELLSIYVYKEFEKAGLSIDDATQKISDTAADLFYIRNADIAYTIKDFTLNDPQKRARFFEGMGVNELVKGGLDADKITDVAHFYAEDIVVIFNEQFQADWGFEDEFGSGIYFYQYEGEWFLAPNMLEDDMSIDLLHADKNKKDDTFFDRKTDIGTIKKIENGYLYLEDTHRSNCYFYADPDQIKGFAVGDAVEITYFSGLAFGMYNLSDDTLYDICPLVEITLHESVAIG